MTTGRRADLGQLAGRRPRAVGLRRLGPQRVRAARAAAARAPARGVHAALGHDSSTSGAARWIASSIASFSVIADDAQPSQLPRIAQAHDALLDAEQLDVAAVGLEVRAHLVERAAHARLERHGMQPVQQQQVRDQLVAGERLRERAVVVALGDVPDDPREALAVEVEQRLHELDRRVDAATAPIAPSTSSSSASTRATRSRAALSSSVGPA